MSGFATDSTAVTLADGRSAAEWRIADVRLEVLAGGLLWVRWPFDVLDAPELAALRSERAEAFRFASENSLGDRADRP
jgi:hypothetical protein